jgi:hypothetical protein
VPFILAFSKSYKNAFRKEDEIGKGTMKFSLHVSLLSEKYKRQNELYKSFFCRITFEF